MPLKLKLRGKVWHIEGRIDELPESDYYRRSTKKTNYEHAQTALRHFKNGELKQFYGGGDVSLPFIDAVAAYDPSPEFSGYLLKVLPYLQGKTVSEITPKMVRDLGKKIAPMNSTDTWHKQVIVPVRAVINNAHDLGLCAPIVIRSYSKDERQKQDRIRGKQSRVPKTPANWQWILSFKEVADPHMGLLCQFMFETAARIGQAVKLKPSDIDFDNMRVFMPEAKGAPAQWVAISPELTAELHALPPKRPRYMRGRTRKLDERVFGFAGRDSVYRKWKRACRDAGIEEIMPHAAGRHGFATEMLVRNKLDPRSVGSMGRFKDVPLMMNTYAHSEDAAQQIQKAIRTGRAQAEKARQANKLNKKGKS